jgi:hypothetical protein
VWQGLVAPRAPLESLDVTLADSTTPDTVVPIGLPPNCRAVLTTITGVWSFEEAWEQRATVVLDELAIPFVGRDTLTANKRATARPKDVDDLDAPGGRGDDKRRSGHRVQFIWFAGLCLVIIVLQYIVIR